jgi:signal transduction histidine kinase
MGAHEFLLVHEAGVCIVAPLSAGGQLFGWIALGPKVNGEAYGGEDLEVLETALGMVAMSLRSIMLYNRQVETRRQLRLRDEQVSELDNLKTSFLGNVNHELRTPVAVVIASLECLRDSLREEAQVNLLSGALQKAEQLRGVVENLLTLSDSTGTYTSIEPRSVDVGMITEEFYRDRLPGLAADLREFVYVQDGDLPEGIVDRKVLLRILDQLLNNALKFTPRGTRVWLKVCAPPGERKGHIRIELQDEGTGIPDDRIAGVFNSFEQVDGSTTRKTGGLGVGLAVAHQLANRMGCSMEVNSPEGEGSVFALIIPVAPGLEQP